MIRLDLVGPHTHLYSTLCGRCPQGPAGCCASPPAVAWADIGRITALGGLDFTLPPLPQEIQAPGPTASSEPESREKADLPGVSIAPGLSLSPDLGSSSPYAIVDPANPRQPVGPLLRVQVPIPP